MDDTPDYIKKKQFDIIMSKPFSERLHMAFDMIDFSRTLIKSGIKRENPDISPVELHIELFRAFYKNDFDEQTLNKIISQMRDFLLKKDNT